MFQLLETFITVYETNNFTKAANALYISQPTISVHIEKLEKELGVKLFERNRHNRISKTAAADLFYQKAKQICNDWEKTKQDLLAASGEARRTFKIAASQTVGGYLLPQILSNLQALHSDVDFELMLDNSTNVYKTVHMLEADIGLVESPEVYPDITRKVFMQDELVVIGDRHLTRWILREPGSGIRQYTDEYFKNEEIIPAEQMMASSNAIILDLVKQGFGRSLQSKLAIAGISEPVQPTNLTRPLYLITLDTATGNEEITQDIFELLSGLDH
ncbi:regulatory helix-turn-helix lysR family protein [Listeria floridensis FSL S10-1187]|uniref:Regulatory helix-turn-helix lysR family protein n=1 Tax=Listeria floridensis FSL S10-1187 TaxID=1265817 RepID=A0ABP3AYD5_9LIST|nr:LysR family transcriptional regulator [Listeria floridensis]EUJ28513.1 regulatory helix-turn-helix lysR family protein [Listeria floridensis FSL S10-1187]